MIGMPAGGNSRGFTIIEIVAVLVILGILAATAVSVVGSMSAYQLTSQADTLKGHLRYAQMRAMNTDNIWGIAFQTANSPNSYRIFNNIAGSTPAFPGTGSDTVTLPAGMTITGIADGGMVAFKTWGSPYTNAAATARQAVEGGWRTITLNHGGRSVDVQIRNETGYIP